MILSIIAAMASNRVIGRDDKMPWDLPSDRRRFHAITRGHPVILGRKTFESIGRPLSLRRNIVLTRQRDYCPEGVVIACDNTGQDGETQAGVAWPSPRFIDNRDGTVSDELTGLIWLKDANCTDTVGGITRESGLLNWPSALTWAMWPPSP